MAEGTRDVLVRIEISLQSMNNLDIYPRSSQLLLVHGLFVDCCFNVFIQDRFQDTAAFEVNVTACELENSFIFDNKA